MTGTAGVQLDRHGPVATVTLPAPGGPDTAAGAVWLRLRDIGRELPGDVRVVVVRGDGGTFWAGEGTGAWTAASTADKTGRPPRDLESRIARCQEGTGWLRRPDLVSVAAVRGAAAGPGFQVALACDLRVLASDAEFSMPEIRWGLAPALGVTGRLVDLVGYARALEICLTARRIGAAEAYRIGLASLVVPPHELQAAVGDLTAALLAAPRAAVAEVKALLATAAHRPYREQAGAEREALSRLLAGLADAGE